jgi:hypothetical protein
VHIFRKNVWNHEPKECVDIVTEFVADNQGRFLPMGQAGQLCNIVTATSLLK